MTLAVAMGKGGGLAGCLPGYLAFHPAPGQYPPCPRRCRRRRRRRRRPATPNSISSSRSRTYLHLNAQRDAHSFPVLHARSLHQNSAPVPTRPTRPTPPVDMKSYTLAVVSALATTAFAQVSPAVASAVVKQQVNDAHIFFSAPSASYRTLPLL